MSSGWSGSVGGTGNAGLERHIPGGEWEAAHPRAREGAQAQGRESWPRTTQPSAGIDRAAAAGGRGSRRGVQGSAQGSQPASLLKMHPTDVDICARGGSVVAPPETAHWVPLTGHCWVCWASSVLPGTLPPTSTLATRCPHPAPGSGSRQGSGVLIAGDFASCHQAGHWASAIPPCHQKLAGDPSPAYTGLQGCRGKHGPAQLSPGPGPWALRPGTGRPWAPHPWGQFGVGESWRQQ